MVIIKNYNSQFYLFIYLFCLIIFINSLNIGTKVESDTITKRKRQLIRAVIDETREMLTKIRDTKKNSIEINLGIGGGENIQENINKL